MIQPTNKSADIASIFPGVQQLIGSANLISGLFELVISKVKYRQTKNFCLAEEKKLNTELTLLSSRLKKLEHEVQTHQETALIFHKNNRGKDCKAVQSTDELINQKTQALFSLQNDHRIKTLAKEFYRENFKTPIIRKAKNEIDEAIAKIYRGIMRLIPGISTIYSIYTLAVRKEVNNSPLIVEQQAFSPETVEIGERSKPREHQYIPFVLD